MPDLIKRTELYVLRPAQYEISGCECGNEDPDWSEFKGHLWCQKCQKDFKPKQSGVFDGPIPINMAHMLGLCFATVNIESGELTKCCETCETELKK